MHRAFGVNASGAMTCEMMQASSPFTVALADALALASADEPENPN